MRDCPLEIACQSETPVTDEHPMMDAVDADGNQVTFGMGIPGTK